MPCFLPAMPRYINKQQHYCSCGPTAIMNALKFMGIPMQYRNDVRSFQSPDFSFIDGMYSEGVHKAFKEYGFYIPMVKDITVTKIEKELRKGHGVVVGYTHSYNPHFIFIEYENEDGTFKVWNDSSLDSGAYNKDKLRGWFSKAKRKNDPPEMWVIKK